MSLRLASAGSRGCCGGHGRISSRWKRRRHNGARRPARSHVLPRARRRGSPRPSAGRPGAWPAAAVPGWLRCCLLPPATSWPASPGWRGPSIPGSRARCTEGAACVPVCPQRQGPAFLLRRPPAHCPPGPAAVRTALPLSPWPGVCCVRSPLLPRRSGRDVGAVLRASIVVQSPGDASERLRL